MALFESNLQSVFASLLETHRVAPYGRASMAALAESIPDSDEVTKRASPGSEGAATEFPDEHIQVLRSY